MSWTYALFECFCLCDDPKGCKKDTYKCIPGSGCFTVIDGTRCDAFYFGDVSDDFYACGGPEFMDASYAKQSELAESVIDKIHRRLIAKYPSKDKKVLYLEASKIYDTSIGRNMHG